jgi:DNA-binding SARP family transcriptional activator
MRFFFISLAALSLVAAPLIALAQTATSHLAPADEYFGRYNESVLEIRNRLATFDGKGDADIQAPDEVSAIDYVEDAVMDWQHKYPADPWVLDAMSRLVECYARAGATQNPRATALLGTLTAAYPKSPRTGEAILALADATMTDVEETPAQPAEAQSVPGSAEISGEVVDAKTGAPVPGAIVIVAPNHESMDIASTAFATTGNDGSFAVKDVPLGAAYTVGAVSLAHAEYIVVEPPRGSAYSAYHGMIDAASGNAQAGIIRLAAR